MKATKFLSISCISDHRNQSRFHFSLSTYHTENEGRWPIIDDYGDREISIYSYKRGMTTFDPVKHPTESKRNRHHEEMTCHEIRVLRRPDYSPSDPYIRFRWWRRCSGAWSPPVNRRVIWPPPSSPTSASMGGLRGGWVAGNSPILRMLRSIWIIGWGNLVDRSPGCCIWWPFCVAEICLEKIGDL